MKCNEFLPKSCMAVQGSIKSFIMSCTVGDAQRSITCIRDCYFFNFCINKPFILIKLSIFVDYILSYFLYFSLVYIWICHTFIPLISYLITYLITLSLVIATTNHKILRIVKSAECKARTTPSNLP